MGGDLRGLGYRCPTPDGPCGSPKDLLIWLVCGTILTFLLVKLAGWHRDRKLRRIRSRHNKS